MGYIDIWYNNSELCPQPGEDYNTFKARATIGLSLLYPSYDAQYIEDMVEEGWSSHIMRNAVQLTVTLQRHVDPNSIYNSYWCDWCIKEVHSAVMPQVTYSSVEKAKPREGDKPFKIAKSVEKKQIVFGWANIAKDANGNYPIDWDGDVTAPEDLEAAAYSYVMKYRAMGEKHEEGSVEGTLIESVMFTKEKQEALGIPDGILPEGWWVGFHIPDKEVFAKVESGEYEMFSVQGNAYRAPTGQ